MASSKSGSLSSSLSSSASGSHQSPPPPPLQGAVKQEMGTVKQEMGAVKEEKAVVKEEMMTAIKQEMGAVKREETEVDERTRLSASVKAYRETYKKEERERLKSYEAEYTRELMSKYFSEKDIFGDDLIEDETVVDGETIKASRWLGTESYADPGKYYNELVGNDSASEGSGSASEGSSSASQAESPTSNGKQSMKKSG